MISPLAYVDPAAKLGKDVIIHPFAHIDRDVEIGDNCEIMPYASIVHGTRIGSGTKVYQGAIVGADPQDFRWKGEETFCIIGCNTTIREHVIINRSIKPGEATRIDDEIFVMAESRIGHDSHIHSKCVIGNNVMIAGGVEVESGTILSSGAMLHEGVHVGKYALVKGGCRIGSNVPPFSIIAHNPATYYGVNSYILTKHAGYDESIIDDIAKAYRHIYQSSTSIFNALIRIEADIEQSASRDEILNFVRSHDLKLVGNINVGN